MKSGEKMLTFNLKKVWFDKIKSGEKTHEYREMTDYWIKRIHPTFVKGITKIESVNKYMSDFYKNIPAATGDLRIVQESLLLILIELDKICKKNNGQNSTRFNSFCWNALV